MSRESKRLSRSRVLQAALQLVDEHGLSALSMRRLAAAVGVEAMSLYHHVRNKADVLDGLHALVLSEVTTPDTGDWQQDVRSFARRFRQVLARHPNTIALFATRPAIGRGSLEKLDDALGLFLRAGCEPQLALGALHALLFFVVGHCNYRFGESDDFAAVHYDGLEGLPHLRIVAEVLDDFDDDAELELGLDLFIEGLRVKLDVGR